MTRSDTPATLSARLDNIKPENHRQAELVDICRILCNQILRQDAQIVALEQWIIEHSEQHKGDPDCSLPSKYQCACGEWMAK